MKYITILRRLSQLAIIFLFCALPWLNIKGFHEIGGSLFAFEFFGLPFADPASATQAIAGGMSLGNIAAWPIWVGGVIALFIAFCLGRVFCGWICPYGLFSELISSIRVGNSKRYQFIKQRKLSIWVKCGIMIIGITSIILIGFPLISLLSFPGELSLVPLAICQGASLGLVVSLFILPLCALSIEFVLGRRIWCLLACPQSLFLGTASLLLPEKMPGLRIFWDEHKCTCGNKSPCRTACSMGINPRKRGGPLRSNCVMCGECIKTCSKYGGALEWKIRG